MPADGKVNQLFDEWAASFVRGENPDALSYLELAGAHADELAALMDGFLQFAPRGTPTDETLLLARAWVRGASPLVELRASRGVRRDQIVDAVMEEFELAPGRRDKVKRYYHELESGLLDPAGLDRRLVDLLARTLRATRDAILVWRPRPAPAAPAYRTAPGQEPRRPAGSRRTQTRPRTRWTASSSRALLDNRSRAMSDPYDEPRAHRLRDAYHAAFGGDELPVPVEQIAEDLLGLAVEVRDDLTVSGMLLPSERRILVRSDEPLQRRRFTVAHELGHWICQCLEGEMRPVYCREEEIGVDPEAKALEREANIFAANLLMPESSLRNVAHDEAPVRFGVSDEAMAWRLFNLGLSQQRPSSAP